jgi:hypothetical protein
MSYRRPLCHSELLYPQQSKSLTNLADQIFEG